CARGYCHGSYCSSGLVSW
nr:immunoglobulin heavy chain junction region [Macaca mulatta]MOX60595.1 immunoglobulin heavy chain junction region [Macaca mulatta]MOX61056.1 immunoglobulin heavy chain junction region [Macaca mulatta]MOX64346.1 immunoglobulin heavy chain junction region [Macaca mulatta]MOX65118.1 immunoglobulin heavy chain junction region [Macaca mulatta]